MTDYLKPSFTVSQRGRDPATCTHGWLTSVRGKLTCRFCGLPWREIWMRELEDAVKEGHDEPR
jgi:hypothetical protein